MHLLFMPWFPCFPKKNKNFKKNKKILKKVLTFQKVSAIMQSNLNITKNDYDEDGRIVEPGESCRLVRGNGETFQ